MYLTIPSKPPPDSHSPPTTQQRGINNPWWTAILMDPMPNLWSCFWDNPEADFHAPSAAAECCFFFVSARSASSGKALFNCTFIHIRLVICFTGPYPKAHSAIWLSHRHLETVVQRGPLRFAISVILSEQDPIQRHATPVSYVHKKLGSGE